MSIRAVKRKGFQRFIFAFLAVLLMVPALTGCSRTTADDEWDKVGVPQVGERMYKPNEPLPPPPIPSVLEDVKSPPKVQNTTQVVFVTDMSSRVELASPSPNRTVRISITVRVSTDKGSPPPKGTIVYLGSTTGNEEKKGVFDDSVWGDITISWLTNSIYPQARIWVDKIEGPGLQYVKEKNVLSQLTIDMPK